MTSAMGLLKTRMGVIVLSAVSLLLLSSTYHFGPNNLPGKAYLSSSASYRRPPPSAWFADGGYLRRDPTNPGATTYELRGAGEGDYSCDQSTITRAGARMCESGLRLLRALHANSIAQIEATSSGHAGGEGGQSEWSEEQWQRMEDKLRRTAEGVKGLRGKRVLYLGDSIDRYPLEELRNNLPSSALIVLNPATGDILRRDDEAPAPPRGWTTSFFNVRLADSVVSTLATDPSYHPARHLHADDFRIDFLFTFGLFHWPASAEEFMARVNLLDTVIRPTAEYNLICINAGIWDMEEIMDREDDVGPGITAAWVDRYIERYINLIGLLRDKYGPIIPIALRLTHDLADATAHFQPLRSEHIRQAQREVARRTGIRLLPFGDRMARQPYYFIGDGVHPTPEANMVHMETVLRMVEES